MRGEIPRFVIIIMDNKEYLHLVRKKINKIVLATNNIDRLMTEKVEDYILVKEQPMPVTIGNKTIFIGTFTIENDYKFWKTYAIILAHIGLKFINFELLNESGDLYKFLHQHKRFYKDLCKLINKHILKQQGYFLNEVKERENIKWTNCNYRYFRKHITYETLMQICKLIYIYNFDAEKKNFQILLGQMGKNMSKVSENYMYFWLQNCIGLTGAFSHAQLIKPSWWSEDMVKDYKGNKKVEKKIETQEIKV